LSHFPFFNLLKKKNRKCGLILSFSAQKPAKAGSARLSACAGRTQAAPWAWAGKATPVRSPAWAAGWPIPSRPSVLIRRPSAHLAEYKTATPRAPEQTLGHFHSVSLSLSLSLRLTALSLFSFLSRSSEPQPRAKEWALHGAVASPLAAAPLWPELGEQCPRLGLLLPARRRGSSAMQRGGRPLLP